MPHIAIVGGGISGLATAYYLQREATDAGLDISCDLYEKSARCGGKIVTDHVDGFTLERGPDSFIAAKPAALQLCHELQLDDQLVPINTGELKYQILVNNKLHPIPTGLRLGIPTLLIPFLKSPAITLPCKLRMMMDFFIPRSPNSTDISMATFLRRRFGNEALNEIFAPLLAGIYVGDPERLSMKSTFPTFLKMEQEFGSLIIGMKSKRRSNRRDTHSKTIMPPFFSLRDGMSKLVDQLKINLTAGLRVSSESLRIERLFDDNYRIHTAEKSPAAHYQAVVISVPSYSAAELVGELDPDMAAELRRIRHLSSANICLGYIDSDIPGLTDSGGSGFLVPASEKRHIRGASWSSKKFTNRAPDGSVLIRVFLGGDGMEAILDRADDDLIKLVREELKEIVGITGKPVLEKVYRWHRSNPQYDVGHHDRLMKIDHCLRKIPGLYLNGCSYRGIGIPDCIAHARKTARTIIHRYLNSG